MGSPAGRMLGAEVDGGGEFAGFEEGGEVGCKVVRGRVVPVAGDLGQGSRKSSSSGQILGAGGSVEASEGIGVENVRILCC